MIEESSSLRFHVIIPARHASTRLPGKPLRLIAGQPMVYHVYQNALLSQAESVIVATDSDEIANVVKRFGGEAAMTSTDHASGTDRIAEVLRRRRWDNETIVVNLQGDEPAIASDLLRLVADALHRRPDVGIATLATPIRQMSALRDPNVVKVVTRGDGQALYFSRAPIPWVRDLFAEGPGDDAPLPTGTPFLRHLGLYAYRGWALRRLAGEPPCPSERAEALEQLRALTLGIAIHVSVVAAAPAHGVDTEDDLARINRQFGQDAE